MKNHYNEHDLGERLVLLDGVQRPGLSVLIPLIVSCVILGNTSVSSEVWSAPIKMEITHGLSILLDCCDSEVCMGKPLKRTGFHRSVRHFHYYLYVENMNYLLVGGQSFYIKDNQKHQYLWTLFHQLFPCTITFLLTVDMEILIIS